MQENEDIVVQDWCGCRCESLVTNGKDIPMLEKVQVDIVSPALWEE